MQPQSGGVPCLHPRPQNPAIPPLLEKSKPAPPLGTPNTEEWLVDEADEESFPAQSDPSAPATGGKKKRA